MSSRTRSDFGTLGDRIAASSGAGQTPPPTPASEPYAVEPVHVWLDGQHAGLLVGWQRPGTGWLGQVVWGPPEHPSQVAVDWVDAARLRRA